MLFAVAGTLVLLLHVFQPWAEARAANTASAWIICTAFGMERGSPSGKNVPPAGAADDCPHCVGACASLGATKQKLPTTVDLAFPAPAAFRQVLVSIFKQEIPAGRLNDPPPAIRAPPRTV